MPGRAIGQRTKEPRRMKTTLALTVLLGCLTANCVVNGWGSIVEQFDFGENFVRIYKNCMAENGVDKNGLTDLYELERGKENAPETTDSAKCAAKCLYMSNGIIYSNGTLANNSKKDEDSKALEDCGRRQKKTSNSCDNAYQLFYCWEGRKLEQLK